MTPTRQTIIKVAVVATLSTIGGVIVAGVMTGEENVRPNTPVKTPAELVAVPVATKDIPVWTKFTKDNVSEYFAFRQYSRKSVPSNAVLDLEELCDKWTWRIISQGETVQPSDLNAKKSIELPDGMVLMSIPLTLEPSAGGFMLPGYKVMVIATRKSEKRQKEIVFPVLEDALILSVDVNARAGTEHVVSFAVPEKQVDLLVQVLESGATVSIKLPGCDEGWRARETAREIFLAAPRTSDEVRAALED